MECQLFMTKRQKEDNTLKSYLLVYFRREGFFDLFHDGLLLSLQNIVILPLKRRFDILVCKCVFVNVFRCIYTCMCVLMHACMHVHTYMHV